MHIYGIQPRMSISIGCTRSVSECKPPNIRLPFLRIKKINPRKFEKHIYSLNFLCASIDYVFICIGSKIYFSKSHDEQLKDQHFNKQYKVQTIITHNYHMNTPKWVTPVCFKCLTALPSGENLQVQKKSCTVIICKSRISERKQCIHNMELL